MLCEVQDTDLVIPLCDSINLAFIEALKYHRANRGAGEAALDVSLFFKNRKNHHKQFAAFWKSVKPSRRRTFEGYLERAGVAISEFDA